MTELSPLEQAFADDGASATMPGGEHAWVRGVRGRGMARYRGSGLPHRRMEAWKYTDLRAALSRHLPVAGPYKGHAPRDRLAADPFAALDAHRMVFVNGYFQEGLSRLKGLPQGVTVAPLGRMLDQGAGWLSAELGAELPPLGEPLQGLNLALMRDGAVIRLAPGVALSKPLHLQFLATADMIGCAAHAHVLVRLEADARALLLESHAGAPGRRLTTLGTEVSLEHGAALEHVKIQADADEALHMTGIYAAAAADAAYDGFFFTTGGGMTRNDVQVRLTGPNARAQVSGATLLDDGAHADNTTVIDHAAPDCQCREVFKSVVGAGARNVFQGKIIVRPGAQRTDGYQLSQALLLSDKAEHDAKPELEIYADDVKCSHGSTVGALDESALFYLESRGLDDAAAKSLLIGAFVREALESVRDEKVRDALDGALEDWLSRHRERIAAAAAGHWSERDADDA